jgi:hypothetical protein
MVSHLTIYASGLYGQFVQVKRKEDRMEKEQGQPLMLKVRTQLQ